MSEKLSEMPIRQEKVNQLKTKLLGEVSEELNHYFEMLHENKFVAGDEHAEKIITRMHNLYELQAFLNWEEGFMCAHNVYPEVDVIVYKLDSNTIDWMLQEEHLLNHILFYIEHSRQPAELVLSDRFFQYDVFSTFDKIAWDKKKEQSVEERIVNATQTCEDVNKDVANKNDIELSKE